MNDIHSTAIIGDSVRLGDGNYVGPFTYIFGNVEMGDGNWIGPHVTIGTAAQYHGPRNEWRTPTLPIRIGNGCTIREYVAVHEPFIGKTIIEDDCYLMAGSQVGHDIVLREKVTLANAVQIGGFSEIGYGAWIGLGATIHQYTTIGAFVMVGMSTVVVKDLPPFTKWAGNPARYLGINEVGLRRNGFSEADIADIIADDHRNGHIGVFLKRNALYNREIAAT